MLLSVSNLTCGYDGPPVLRDVNFVAAQKEKLFIIGPNGCGKTTLLRAVAGLLPYAGDIKIGGVNAVGLTQKQRARKVALMSQHAQVYFAYSVYETVLQGRYAHLGDTFFKNIRQTDKDVVDACLQTTGLTDIRDKSVRALSGGQLQRTFLARVLVQEPQVILLDEPTNHLDFRYQLELMAYLDEWVKGGERAVIGVMHDMNLALQHADRLLILKDGEVFAHGDANSLDLDVLDKTFEAEVRAFMVRSLDRWVK